MSETYILIFDVIEFQYQLEFTPKVSRQRILIEKIDRFYKFSRINNTLITENVKKKERLFIEKIAINIIKEAIECLKPNTIL